MKARIRSTQEYRYYRTLQKQGESISQGFLEDLLDKRIKITGTYYYNHLFYLYLYIIDISMCLYFF